MVESIFVRVYAKWFEALCKIVQSRPKCMDLYKYRQIPNCAVAQLHKSREKLSPKTTTV